MKTVKCGDANPKGNISFLFKGGCGKELPIEEAYRCTGCGGWFHRECIFKHFELEEKHSVAHRALKKIRDYSFGKNWVRTERIQKLCVEGLNRRKQI